jgi:hypothetical protein
VPIAVRATICNHGHSIAASGSINKSNKARIWGQLPRIYRISIHRRNLRASGRSNAQGETCHRLGVERGGGCSRRSEVMGIVVGRDSEREMLTTSQRVVEGRKKEPSAEKRVMRDASPLPVTVLPPATYGLYGFCAWGSGGAAAEVVAGGQTPQSGGRAEKTRRTRAAGYRQLDFKGCPFARSPPRSPKLADGSERSAQRPTRFEFSG